MQTFEGYLLEKHCECNPELPKDVLVDDFNDWLERIGFDGILDWGKRYGQEVKENTLKDLVKMAEEKKYRYISIELLKELLK